MMKSVCLISRLRGSTPEAFRDYYENHHSRLGSRYFPFTKYVRNYLVSASPSVDFDVITEFFFDPNVNVAGVHSGRVREILDEDERNFMEQQLIRPAGADEALLAGAPREVEGPGRQRQILLLNPATGAKSDFREAVASWGRQLGDNPELLRVTVDYTAAQPATNDSGFPYQALLSLWLSGDESATSLSAPVGIQVCSILLTEVYESTPELLAELYSPEPD